jgi:MFS family permease
VNIKWLIRSQSFVTLASGMIYPYYLLFLKNLGNSYSAYGLAFAVFIISSAAFSQWLAPRLDRLGIQVLLISSLGMMASMLLFPWVSSYIWVLFVQIVMGACNAMQRMSERLLLADHTEQGLRGPTIGNYHFWTSVASGFAVLLGGYLIDWLTINALFYTSALLYGFSAWVIWREIKSVKHSQ